MAKMGKSKNVKGPLGMGWVPIRSKITIKKCPMGNYSNWFLLSPFMRSLKRPGRSDGEEECVYGRRVVKRIEYGDEGVWRRKSSRIVKLKIGR